MKRHFDFNDDDSTRYKLRQLSSFGNVMYGCWISTSSGKVQRRSYRIRNNTNNKSICQDWIDIENSSRMLPQSFSKNCDINSYKSTSSNPSQKYKKYMLSPALLRIRSPIHHPSFNLNGKSFTSIVKAEMVYYCFEMLLKYLHRNHFHDTSLSPFPTDTLHNSLTRLKRRSIPSNCYSLRVPKRFWWRQTDRPSSSLSSSSLTSSFDNAVYPLFVTWRKGKEGNLRGCIGTFYPVKLTTGLKEYAISSAVKDTRFKPITPEEVPLLQCAVSILTDFEDISHCTDWEIGKHGIKIELITMRGRKSATYLPEVASEQGWNHIQTIDSLLRKAGYKGKIDDSVRGSLKLIRYRSEKICRAYDDYIEATSRQTAIVR